jgi:hypothetical protein
MNASAAGAKALRKECCIGGCGTRCIGGCEPQAGMPNPGRLNGMPFMGFPLAWMAGNLGFSVAHDETYVDVSADDEELRRCIPPAWFRNILLKYLVTRGPAEVCWVPKSERKDCLW